MRIEENSDMNGLRPSSKQKYSQGKSSKEVRLVLIFNKKESHLFWNLVDDKHVGGNGQSTMNNIRQHGH